jgi:phage antirepressor YoqD-like protein
MFNPIAKSTLDNSEKKATDKDKSVENKETSNSIKEEKPKTQYMDFGLGRAQALPGAQYLN